MGVTMPHKKTVYKEDYHGIHYLVRQGDTLLIRASSSSFTLQCFAGVLHLLSKNSTGRTALFMADCEFYQTDTDWIITVAPGTASYIKELYCIRKISKTEGHQLQLGKLW